MKTILVTVFCILFFTSGAAAEFGAWAPINPTFLGGNPFAGQFLLNKAQATNENQEDITHKIEEQMKELTAHIDNMTEQIGNLGSQFTGSLGVEFNLPVMIQSGSGNSGVIGMGTGSQPQPGSSLRPGFNPTSGLE